MPHENIFSISLILNGKMLDFDMSRRFSQNTVVDHIDSRHVVFKELSGTVFVGIPFAEGQHKGI